MEATRTDKLTATNNKEVSFAGIFDTPHYRFPTIVLLRVFFFD